MAMNINAVELTKAKAPVVKQPLPFLYKVDGKRVLIKGILDKKILFEAPSNPFKPDDSERKKLAIIGKLNWQIKKETKKASFKMIEGKGSVRSFFNLLSWTTRQISDYTLPREPITKGAVISAFFYDEKTKELLSDVFIAIYTGAPKDKDKFIECTQVQDLEVNTVKDMLNTGKCLWYDNSNKDKRYEIRIENP
jgi:hypothetical protein